MSTELLTSAGASDERLARVVAFLEGRVPGSYGRGSAFELGEGSSRASTNGTCASLCGLESAQTAEERDLALRRVWLLYGLALSLPGLPMVYAGDEVGVLNDRAFLMDPEKERDSRWVHRPPFPWEVLREPGNVGARMHAGLTRRLHVRREREALGAAAPVRWLDARAPRVLSFIRGDGPRAVLVLANLGRSGVEVAADLVEAFGRGPLIDLLDDAPGDAPTALGPYQVRWCAAFEAQP